MRRLPNFSRGKLLPVSLEEKKNLFPSPSTKNRKEDVDFVLFFREKLQLEIAARERAEKKNQEFEERFKMLAEDLAKKQQDLHEAQDLIRRLEEQLKQTQAAKEELEQRQNELEVRLTKNLKRNSENEGIRGGGGEEK